MTLTVDFMYVGIVGAVIALYLLKVWLTPKVREDMQTLIDLIKDVENWNKIHENELKFNNIRIIRISKSKMTYIIYVNEKIIPYELIKPVEVKVLVKALNSLFDIFDQQVKDKDMAEIFAGIRENF